MAGPRRRCNLVPVLRQQSEEAGRQSPGAKGCKKSDIDKIVRNVAGPNQVQDDIRVLPLSPNDERLRQRVARAIYADPSMTKYAIQAMKPIHVIVENGHVTLDGVVATDFDKQIAGTRAAGVGMSFGPIVNNLQVENPAKKS